MQVANLELSIELHQLSGWDDTEFAHTEWKWDDDRVFPKVKLREDAESGLNSRLVAPAYDLGYLLRKLPEYHGDHPVLGRVITGVRWSISYGAVMDHLFINKVADTPEDTACKLCIELFRQGVLTREAV